MLSKLQKRYIVVIIAYTVSVFIWSINESFGNVFKTNLILSTTTFLLIYVPFEIYFSFRDIWFERWGLIESPKIAKKDIKIPVASDGKAKYLGAQIINPSKQNGIEDKNTLVLISHGFSDTIKTYHYLYIPLVLHGYTLLTYDSRGIGRSKHLGKRYEFENRVEDFKAIVKWIKGNDKFSEMSLYAIGFSIGAMITLLGGFKNTKIQKIVAVSSISSYKNSIRNMNPVVILTYLFKRVPLFISDDKSRRLSPVQLILETKKNNTRSEWSSLKKRVMLIHSKNDKVTPLQNFVENSRVLELKESNKLLFNRGGHSMKKNEIELVAAILRFFNEN